MSWRQRVPALLQVRSRACVTCAEPADLYCSNCGVTPYCSTKCQMKDWPARHSAVCHNLVRLSEMADVSMPVVDPEPRIQNPAPLRRPHTVTDDRRDHTERRSRPARQNQSQRRDDDADTAGSASGRNNKSDSFRHLQDRSSQPHQHQNRNQEPETRNQDRRQSGGTGKNHQTSTRTSTPNQNGIKNCLRRPNKQKLDEDETEDWGIKKEEKPMVKFEDAGEAKVVKPDVKTSPAKTSTQTASPAPKTPQMTGVKQAAPGIKLCSIEDVTPTRKVVPKNYLIEQLAIGDTVLLSVEAKASDCKTTAGDYVCLSMHEKYELDYQSLCEDYVLECDADNQEVKPTPGEACSYFNVEDGAWYRARCLNPTTIALLDSCKIVTVTATDKIRKLPPKYEQVPEFSCVLECKNTEVGSNLSCLIAAKEGDGYKVTLKNMETDSSVGEGVLKRWMPTVEYPPVKPVIPEVPRPAVSHNSGVVLVDATALDRVFVRPADTRRQSEYDDIVHGALLAGRKASPLTEAPVKGQTVIAKFTDGLHYRALCKRTHVGQNKYLLEYIDYGNVEICRNLEDLFPCPPNLDLAAAPTQVSMIKLTSEGGEFTPPATEYIEKLKDSCEEMILTLPSGESSAPSGSEAVLKLSKNSENVNKKVIEMCTPDWKKFQEKGGDVVELEPLMYCDLEYQQLPSGPVELVITDYSVFQGGMLSGYVKGDPHADHLLSHVTQKMAEYCNSEIGREPYLPKAEELCIAQCPPYTQWFRAVLLEQVQGAGGSRARVCYVDYGNVDEVPVTLLRKMLPEFVRGLPVLGSNFEIEDFPAEPSEEMLARAVQYMRVDDEGRGTLKAQRLDRLDDGLYRLRAPDLLKAMLLH